MHCVLRCEAQSLAIVLVPLLVAMDLSSLRGSAVALGGRSSVWADALKWGRSGRILMLGSEKGVSSKGENGRADLTVYVPVGTSVRGLSALRQGRGTVR